jgi:ankyrin repeat protein
MNARDNTGKNALLLSLTNHHNRIARFLVKHGINVNATDKSGLNALLVCVYNYNLKFIRFLIRNGIDLKKFGQQALNYAIKLSRNEIARVIKKAM